MSGIVDLLNSDLGKKIIGGISQETHQPVDKTASVVAMAMPILLGAMKRNASSDSGAANLMNALNNKHDGSILDNLTGLFGGGVNEDVKQDGLGILGHVLGGSQDNAVHALSQKSGLDTNSVMQILQVAAPILLGYLGKQKQERNVSSESGIGDLLGSLMGGSNKKQPQQQSLIESLLDGNNDGSVIDDIAGMFLGGNKKKGGIAGMLGGFFGK
ncbi:DUF937 domain-containing protein [Aequorivita lipolytica]|uniref:DUF937 domain-containing protein n=1 Tax=Aequorivita lipolytica TaxID=153267 RepID=A0A5C6YNL9_9FLAO|nr:DUF937 domain-containing protein [Aequorivita lipolytica]TXD69202.1 DUF937 domain-containing protein [Aequorivita lipolytica]SRX51212.1 hypothetical protein AEQU2_01692 [Aequorivita lipolytica]